MILVFFGGGFDEFMMIRWAKIMFKQVMMLGFLPFADTMNSTIQQNIVQIL